MFPKRSKPKSDFRVWNSQLIQYAGYKNPDGTILGDPANAEFTTVSKSIGAMEFTKMSTAGSRGKESTTCL